MSIKKTSHLTLVPIPSPSAAGSGSRPALLAFSKPEDGAGGRVEVTLPPGSGWRPGPYFHQLHDEVLEVLDGSVDVTLNGKRTVLKKHGSVRVEKGVVVDWLRAAASAGADDGPCRLAIKWEPEDSRMELYWRTYVSLLLHDIPAGPPHTGSSSSSGGAAVAVPVRLPSRFSLLSLRLARQADQYPSPTPSILFSPLTLVLVYLVWLWDMLTAQGWTEEEQMGRGVLRRDWVPREVWEEVVDGKKHK